MPIPLDKKYSACKDGCVPVMQYNVLIIHVPIRITEEDRHKMFGCLVSSLAITTPPEATLKW